MRVCSWQDKTKCCRCLEKLNNILVHVDFKGFCLIFRTFKHTDCLAYETWLTNWTINSLVFRLLSTERFSLSSGMQRWLFIWWTLCKHVKDRGPFFLRRIQEQAIWVSISHISLHKWEIHAHSLTCTGMLLVLFCCSCILNFSLPGFCCEKSYGIPLGLVKCRL